MKNLTPGEREDRTLEVLQDFARRGAWAQQLAAQKTRELLSGWNDKEPTNGDGDSDGK